MSIFRHNTLGSWTRGGQAAVHNVRMTLQVFKQTVLAAVVLWLMGILAYANEVTDTYSRAVLIRSAEAWFQVNVVTSPTSPILFPLHDGPQYWAAASEVLRSGIVQKTTAALEQDLMAGAALSGVVTLIGLWCAWYYFTTTGRGLGSNKFLRGAKFATARQLRRHLFWAKKGCLQIGGIRLPAAFEPEHILISGAPGTGKTNALNRMLEGIRKDGRRAIVYDTAGTFVERFYRPGRDILLNPLDARTVQWSPWVDVPEDYHYDQLAESVVPDSGKDPFWAKAARGTLVAVMRTLVQQRRMLVSVLLQVITRSRLKALSDFVDDTEGSAFISPEGDRTSAGIQAELASVLRGFRYLDDTSHGLSIREWVTNERDDSWLFVTVKADQLPTLRPLITLWLDIAISAIMSMKPDQHRRLFCVIDELPSLQRLPSLGDFLARARKYGGCGILGFQSYPQLEATYGVQEAAALTGYCSTWIAMRANDTPTAKHVSENLGQTDQVEANEGMSYGVNDMRDGVNLSRMQVTRPLVMPTEIVNLPNLVGYLRLGRDLPVIRFKDRYCHGSAEEPGFVDRKTPPVRLTPEADGGDASVEPAPNGASEVLGALVLPADVAWRDRPAPGPRPTRSPQPRLAGPQNGAPGKSVFQQSRPDGPWEPSTPAY